jgi:hypothetical protein
MHTVVAHPAYRKPSFHLQVILAPSRYVMNVLGRRIVANLALLVGCQEGLAGFPIQSRLLLPFLGHFPQWRPLHEFPFFFSLCFLSVIGFGVPKLCAIIPAFTSAASFLLFTSLSFSLFNVTKSHIYLENLYMDSRISRLNPATQ